ESKRLSTIKYFWKINKQSITKSLEEEKDGIVVIDNNLKDHEDDDIGNSNFLESDKNSSSTSSTVKTDYPSMIIYFLFLFILLNDNK
ncbi:6907_t:CDS:1, partial [Dentiscutata erythropus]